MKINRIALVDICDWFPGNKLEPFAIEYIGAVLKQAGYKFEPFQQRKENLLEFAKKILRSNPDLVGISSYTYKFPEALRLAKVIKSWNPKIVTVLGGYHATGIPTDIKYGYFDIFVMGEGEETFIKLLKTINSSNDYKNIRGIAYIKNNKIIINPRRKRIIFSKLPPPLRKKEFFRDTEILGIKSKEGIAQITYSRGCPFNCYYCCSPKMWERKVQYRNPKNVVCEMRNIAKNFGIRMFYFTDLTFNTNIEKISELTNLLKKERFGWICSLNLDIDNLNEKLIRELAEAGCRVAMFGIEDIEGRPSQLLNRKTKKNKKRFDKIYHIFRACDRYGIITVALLMFSRLTKRTEKVEHHLTYLKILLPDIVRTAILTPLPGSKFFEEIDKKDFLYQNFPNSYKGFDTKQSVIKHIDGEKIKRLTKQFKDAYYLSKEYYKHLKEKNKMHLGLEQTIKLFYSWLLKKHKVSKGSHLKFIQKQNIEKR